MTGAPSCSRIHRTLEVLGISAFLAFAVLLAGRLYELLDSPGAWGVALACLPAGYVVADFLSGFVHWLADRFGSPDTPVLGPNFIKPFRDHHVRPEEITTHDFVETNGNNCLVSFWVLAVAWWWGPTEAGDLAGVAGLALPLWSMLAILGTNQFHKWAHMDRPPRLVARLQRLRLVLSPDHHRIHHASPHDTHYCITTGWLNGLLARLRFFERLERVARRWFGLVAGEDDACRVAPEGESPRGA